MTSMRPEQPTPDYVPGHDLLAGKVVVVTAAAGAGIGAAVARRALEEGANMVVISDTHERRLAESQESLAAEFGEERVRALAADVTDEAQVQALLDVADEHGGVDVMINNAGLGGTEEIMKNILAERVLGLPKEPGVDPDTPFRELRRSGAPAGGAA